MIYEKEENGEKWVTCGEALIMVQAKFTKESGYKKRCKKLIVWSSKDLPDECKDYPAPRNWYLL